MKLLLLSFQTLEKKTLRATEDTVQLFPPQYNPQDEQIKYHVVGVALCLAFLLALIKKWDVVCPAHYISVITSAHYIKSFTHMS